MNKLSLLIIALITGVYFPPLKTIMSQNNLGHSLVSVSGRQLIVSKRLPDGALATPEPFIIRAVNWSPASKSSTSDFTDRRNQFAIWKDVDLPMIKAMNANTVRLYLDPGADANGRAVLDSIYHQNLMAIVTVDDGLADLNRVQQVVNFYKGHPAVLMWSIGNEWNIAPFNGAPDVPTAAQRVQNAAALIKTLDADHPVATSYGDIDINDAGRRLADTQHYVNNVCAAVDVWALNVYRGSNFGMVFGQWRSITNKPMFIGEYGTDAFRTTGYPPLSCPVAGFIDQAAQAEWDVRLWNDLLWNLSAKYPNKPALGGALFEWNDEWWKVAPAGSQQNCGHDKNPGGHPDIVANEEYFGVVDINRQPRQIYTAMQTAYAPNYQPPPTASTLRAESSGANSGSFAKFLRDGISFYFKTGGAGGGRGFNVAVIDPCDGELLQPVQNFDTWGSRDSGAAHDALRLFLQGLPNGVLVLIAIGDEAGLNEFPPIGCVQRNRIWIEPLFQALGALGSQHIRNYCYWDSWSLIAVKGTGSAIAEQLNHTGQAMAETSLAAPASISPTSRTLPAGGGDSAVNVLSAASCGWTAVSNAAWITITGGSSGAGNGVVSYSVAVNPGPVRSGTITIAGQTFIVTQAAPAVGLQYYPLPKPIRLLDTRPNATACFKTGLPLQTGVAQSQPARVTCDGVTIPANAAAVVGNATVVNFLSGPGFITLYPAGSPQPTVSNLNYLSNQIVPNAFTVGLGTNGEFEIFASSATHFIVDITGYYAPPGAGGLYYHPLPHPVRLLDTRQGETACDSPATPLPAGPARIQQARGTCDGVTIPASAAAIVGNATVVNFLSGPGFITLYPTGANQPTASNLNYLESQIIPNAFTVGLGVNGEFNIFASSVTDFIADITGYYSAEANDVNGAGLLYYPLARPIRLLDSRPGEPSCDTLGSPLAGGQSRAESAWVACDGIPIPISAKAVVGNATAVNFLSGPGFITLYPSDAQQPTVSNLNYLSNQVIPNAFTVGLGNDGAFKIFAATTTHFIADLTGYFAL